MRLAFGRLVQRLAGYCLAFFVANATTSTRARRIFLDAIQPAELLSIVVDG
jgi:hypothetical protein